MILDNLFDDINDLEDDYDDEFELDGNNKVIIRAENIINGADTLSEAAYKLRAYADYLDGLSDAGFELTNTIDNDFGVALLP